MSDLLSAAAAATVGGSISANVARAAEPIDRSPSLLRIMSATVGQRLPPGPPGWVRCGRTIRTRIASRALMQCARGRASPPLQTGGTG
uniref:Putative secreted protein n=1 Tax=Anopheles triannulatus TaxID=58253 RepID=A0A2M4B4R2_9DIPT